MLILDVIFAGHARFGTDLIIIICCEPKKTFQVGTGSQAYFLLQNKHFKLNLVALYSLYY